RLPAVEPRTRSQRKRPSLAGRTQPSGKETPMRWRVVALAMAVMVVGGFAVLLWTGKENWRQQCTDTRPDVRIAGCTAIIAGGGDKPVNLAIAAYNRGLAYAEREDYDRAIEDFDRVIKLDPN